MATILCVDDDTSVGIVIERTLTRIGHHPLLVSSVDEAIKAMDRIVVDLVIADSVMPRRTGLDLLRTLENERHRIPVIIMTSYSSIEDAVTSMQSGAIDYLIKPIRAETIEIAVTRSLEQMRLRGENDALRGEVEKLRSQWRAGGSGVLNLEELERMAINRALKATGGNRTRAAKLLGINERTLRNRLNGPKAMTGGA
jgi:DNA-binding NtrC family response regulator